MTRIVVGIVLALHGLVHLLYAAHGQRVLELQPDMRWPDDSWALSGLLGTGATRAVAAGWCLVGAMGFLTGSVGYLMQQGWWQPLIIVSASLSIAMVVILWDGRLRSLDDQGLIALLLNGLILVILVVLRWPASP